MTNDKVSERLYTIATVDGREHRVRSTESAIIKWKPDSHNPDQIYTLKDAGNDIVFKCRHVSIISIEDNTTAVEELEKARESAAMKDKITR